MKPQDAYKYAQTTLAGKNWPKFFELLKAAADTGYPPAQCALGMWYLEGLVDNGRRVIRRSRARAFQLIAAAAHAGHLPAFEPLGYCYDTAQGVAHDQDAAIRWYKRAVQYDRASAAYNIATIYRERSDIRGEIRWLQRAAALGGAYATIDLGEFAKAGRLSRNARSRVWVDLKTLARSRSPWRQDAAALLSQLEPTRVGKTAAGKSRITRSTSSRNT